MSTGLRDMQITYGNAVYSATYRWPAIKTQHGERSKTPKFFGGKQWLAQGKYRRTQKYAREYNMTR